MNRRRPPSSTAFHNNIKKPAAKSSSPSSSSVAAVAAPAPLKSPSAARPLYSSRLGDAAAAVVKARATDSSDNSTSPTTRQPPVPQQKAWSSAKNPITGRANTAQQQNNSSTANRNSGITSLREGQRVIITLASGAAYEGVYASDPSDPANCILRMVQPKPTSHDSANGTSKRDQSSTMSFARKDVADARVAGGNTNKVDAKAQNGNRPTFRTDRDTSNANRRFGGERELQRWQPDATDGADGSLEGGLQGSKSHGGAWDQFAENERLFGLRTDYDEAIYTTTIDKSHPQYKQRMAAAERKAREIERSTAATSHVAEERVMDFVGGDDNADEEDKYSGVKRQQQDFPPLANRENKYTPPARRAPVANSTVKGVPVDPAIISSQIKGAPSNKQPTPKPEETKAPVPTPNKSPVPPATEKPAPAPVPAPVESKPEAKSIESNPTDSKPAEAKTGEAKPSDKSAGALRPSATTGRTISPQGKEAAAVPSATSTVERDVLNSFKNFATQQRLNAEKARSNKAKADKEVKLIELKKFADSFKLSTPVPTDLISIIAKDPAKQKQIQDKAIQNAEDVAKAKEHAKDKLEPVTKDIPAKTAVQQTPTPPATATPSGTSTTAARTPATTQHTSSPSGVPNRHPGPRQPYNGQQYSNRNGRSPGQNMAPHYQPTGNLAQRLRNVEQQKLAQPPQHHVPQDMRLPPTGPANAVDPYGNRRLSGLAPSHVGPKLNPNTQEFRPSPFAQSFNPVGPSGASSPRSSVNNAVEAQSTATPVVGQLIRRKTKSIDVKKCFILSHIQTLQPPHNNRTWEENGGLRPSFDTIPTWKQLMDEDPADSTMRLTYAQYFERQPFSGAALATPNPPHVVPQMAHQHQLPFHLQHGAHSLAPRQSPHMPPMQMHSGQPNHTPHVPFNGDDHRMMHSNSAQSFASPRMTQVPMAYPPAMNSPAQMPYNQPVMQPFMGPGTPQMGQFRNFSQTPQFMPQQPSHMSTPLMVPQQYMAGPNPMVTATPQMQMYPGGHPQFMPPGPAPPQPMPGANGYPSPGRPAAPMMVHQGSQQGQPMYGMSPGMQYQQPVFTPQQPGQMSNMRGYSNPGSQQYGTSPQQMHQFGPQHRNGSYGGKSFSHGSQHHGPSSGQTVQTGPQGRTPDSQEEAK